MGRIGELVISNWTNEKRCTVPVFSPDGNTHLGDVVLTRLYGEPEVAQIADQARRQGWKIIERIPDEPGQREYVFRAVQVPLPPELAPLTPAQRRRLTVATVLAVACAVCLVCSWVVSGTTAHIAGGLSGILGCLGLWIAARVHFERPWLPGA